MSTRRQRRKAKARPAGKGQRFIRTKPFLLGLLAFGAAEIVLSWRAIGAPAPVAFSPLGALSAAAATFLCIALVGSSSFLGDRLVFGPAAVAMFLHTLIDAFLPGPDATRVLRILIWLTWIALFAGGVYTLVKSPIPWPGWGAPREE